MVVQFLFSHLFISLAILVISCVNGLNIEFYEHGNFTGLFWTNNQGECINIPHEDQPAVYSIKTDTCIIVYGGENCDSYWSMKYLAGSTILSDKDLGREEQIKSYHTCNEEEGGNQLNLDITDYYEKYSWGPPRVFESYRNVCSCVNVPQRVLNMEKWSINNHHNDILAYFEADCSEDKWDARYIPAGYSWNSTSASGHSKKDRVTNTTDRIQSFGPDPNSPYFRTSCSFSNDSSKNRNIAGLENIDSFQVTRENNDILEQLKSLANKIVILQSLFQVSMKSFYNQQKNDFVKLNDEVTELEKKLK